jgi:hypothetical protein
MHTSILSVLTSDLLGVNPATLNEMILYYRLMTKWSGLGDKYGIISGGVVTVGTRASVCTGVIRLMLIT